MVIRPLSPSPRARAASVPARPAPSRTAEPSRAARAAAVATPATERWDPTTRSILDQAPANPSTPQPPPPRCTPFGGQNKLRSLRPPTPVAVVPPAEVAPYRPPPGTEIVRRSWGAIIWQSLVLLLLAPIYLAAALVCALPALVGGAIAAPKEDQLDGTGTFGGGFIDVFRAMMRTAFVWINEPTTALINSVWMNLVRRTYMVDRSNPNDILFTRRIHLTGTADDIARTKALETWIETHLALPPYRVDIQFVDHPDDYSTTIPIDPTVWTNAGAWNPFTNDDQIDVLDVPMMAHETLHLFGLPDEYDLRLHMVNEQMGFWHRLAVFAMALVQRPAPVDHDQSIMDNHWNKPLARHYQGL